MYAIYGSIYHQYTEMFAYIPYMDPMGYNLLYSDDLQCFMGMPIGTASPSRAVDPRFPFFRSPNSCRSPGLLVQIAGVFLTEAVGHVPCSHLKKVNWNRTLWESKGMEFTLWL